MKVRILIVDETAFVRDALKRALRSFIKELEIFDAVNGSRAIAVLRSNKISLIISKWDMDEMSGAELLQWVRNDERSAKSPFIAMSDGSNRNLVMAAIQAGASDFLAKPFTSDEVQKKVVKQLTRMGFKPKAAAPSSENSGFGSVAVLSSAAPAAPESHSANKSKKAHSDRKYEALSKFNGYAQLQTEGYTLRCNISELSKIGLVGSIARVDATELPRILDSAVATIKDDREHTVGTLNVYIFAMQASEPKPDAKTIAIKLRFFNNPSDSIAQLNEAIAGR